MGSGSVTPAVTGGNSNFTITAVNGTWSITQATSTVNLSCPASVTYNGTAQTPCTATATGVGGLSQSITVTYTNNANAGTATASATFAGDTNHTTSTNSMTFGISPAVVTATAGSYTGIYDGAAHSPSACVVIGTYTTGLSCTNSPSSVGPGVGSGSVAPSAIGSNGNFAITLVNGSWSITQAMPVVTAWPTPSAITYGQTLGSSTLVGGIASVPGSFTFTVPGALPIAGTQIEGVTFIPTDLIDYTTVSSTVTVTVNPASYIVTVSGDDAGTASNCTPQTTPGHGTDASCSLRDALLQSGATGGGKISFDATVFAAPSTIKLANGTLTVPSATTITGASQANLVTVDGNGSSTVFTVASGVTGASIANLTIQHGSGGGIQNAGTLTLTADSVMGNTASGPGGGIVNSGMLTLNGSTVSNNIAAGSGGGISNSGSLTLVNDTISGNSSSGSGGGVYNTSALALSDTTVSGNSAGTASGGGIQNAASANVTLANAIVSGNTANSAADDFDGATYTDNAGNVVGIANGTPVNGNAIALAPLGSYGGPMARDDWAQGLMAQPADFSTKRSDERCSIDPAGRRGPSSGRDLADAGRAADRAS